MFKKILLAIMCFIFASSIVEAKTESWRAEKKLARQLVAKLMMTPFMKNQVLPVRISLARALLQDTHQNPQGSEIVTDFILNEVLANPKILVVNQDLRADLSMDFKLMHYSDVALAKHKAQLLGAEYLLQTEFFLVEPEKSSSKAKLAGKLLLLDMKTNAVVVSLP